MDLDLFNKVIAIAALVVGMANTVWIWLRRPGEAMSLRLKECEDDVAAGLKEVRLDQKNHDRRIQALEDNMKHLPTKEDLHEIETTLTDVKATLRSLNSTVTRMDDFLRERATR